MKKKEYTKPEMQVVNITSCTPSQPRLYSKEKVTQVDQNWKKTGIMVSNSYDNA